MKKLVKNISSI